MTTDDAPFALVVDDDALILMDAVTILEDAGFRTLEAGDGDQAIEVMERHHLNIVLLFSDVDMPGSRNGFALAREVAVRWPHISLVIASGRVTPGPDDLPEGAHFIGKPFSAEVVHGRLRQVLPDGHKPTPLKRVV